MLIENLMSMIIASKTARKDNRILSATSERVQVYKGFTVMKVSDCLKTRMYGKNSGKIPVLYTVVSEVPVFAFLLHPVKDSTPPPAECYKLHLCTNDSTGELI